ncbi:hypothetical protein V6N12_054990 [Hibiscus sabdariffa]|uniref:Uncharacterized protein n=1 Tax=Hibiscus sabdariffa TaxID=183260 RepID=A0ABR2D2E8_9ROSI
MVDLECEEGRLGGSCSVVPNLGKGPPLDGSAAATVVSGDGVSTLDWASIFSGQSLTFYPPVQKDGKLLVQPPLEEGGLSQVEHVVGVSKDVVVPSQQVMVEECLLTADMVTSSTVDGNIGVDSSAVTVALVASCSCVGLSTVSGPDVQENADVIGVVSNKQVNDDVTGHELDILGRVNDDIVANGSGVVPSVNKFAALCDAVEQDGVARLVRATAGGVADLMERLKPKEKGGKKKGKGRGVGKDRGLKDGASPCCQ